MTSLFKLLRFIAFACVFAASAIVLGVSGWFGSIFLPNLHKDFIIFALTVSTFTIVVLGILALRSQPRVDAILLFIMAASWLALGAFSADVIGHVECVGLEGQTMPTNNGTIASDVYCREVKVILAFSWANFVMLASCFIFLIALTVRVHARGNRHVWHESISDLPWFGQWVENHRHYPVVYPVPVQGQVQPQWNQPYIATPGSQVVYQQPGHSIVVTQTPSGARQITQVPA